MGFLFGLHKKERTVAIFDIGSGSIGGAVVRLPSSENSIPVILKSVRHEIKTEKDFNFSIFMKNMLSALYQTADDLYQQKAGVPDEIFCVLASPWYLSETRVVKMSDTKSFIFNKRLADELIQKEISGFKDMYKNKYGSLDSIPELIEQHIMSVSLNGYAVNDPFGRKCKLLEMDMIISLVPKLCLDEIRKILSKIYHHKNVSFSSFTVDTYFAVRDKYVTPDSYLLLDISGEITDVGIVTKGVLKSVLSFPFGKKTFFKYMCTKLEIELRDAKELFKLYSTNNLSSAFKQKVEPLFKSIENSWGEAFSKCLSTLPRILILPNTIFLTADNDIRNWFVNVLQDEENIQSMVSGHKCIVVNLDGPEFLNQCDIKNGDCDPFLMIEAIALTRKKIK
ncbi:MAG: hypothetical protein WC603_03445 [Candidatus Paceibacterota bacterium]|jgi:hypothetical protein